MAHIAGLVTGTLLLLAVLNLQQALHIPVWFQAVLAVALGALNGYLWSSKAPPPIPLRDAIKYAAQWLAIVLALAVIDTAIGTAAGASTVSEAFLNSGMFGGPADLFLFLAGLFVGAPTLVRSVLLHRVQNAT
ncbi:hypothetical protein AACH06_29675 [Ideonella sp. DXS29W]|uniref:Uncharacterized protein n=1 Tax=Ideonella lacteola TaxID=2984193 RepID=A0ABU9BYE5_9BURK